MQSLIFDQSGVGKPFKLTMEELEDFFADNGLDLSRLVGPDFEQSLGDGKSTCGFKLWRVKNDLNGY